MTVDFTVADRQMFGTSYSQDRVDSLVAGMLEMPPHPVWHLPDEIDWAVDPFADANWMSQLHMLRWLDPLRRAAIGGDTVALDLWRRHVSGWVRDNPREAPASPWAWSDMVEATRAIQLCLTSTVLRDRSPADLDWLIPSVQEHAEHLADPANLGRANHALHQHEALFVCGRFLRRPDLVDQAVAQIHGLLSQEYDEQGVNREGATAYHSNNYIWWNRVLRRLDAEGIPRHEAASRLQLAPEELAHATRPDGTLVTIGDTDRASVRAIRTPMTTYVTTGGTDGEPPEDLVKIYDAGYVFARSGWGETEREFDEETFFSVSFGRSDRVHGHPDGGSLTYSADRVNWLVDPGKFQYGASVPRRHFLSRGAHSLVSIDGRKPRLGATVRLVDRRVSARAYDLLFNDDSFEGVELTRRVIYSVSGEYVVVVDRVSSDVECVATSRWQLGPQVEATVRRQTVALTSGERRATLHFTGTAAKIETVVGQQEPFDGWVATEWKRKVPAPVVMATKSGRTFRFITSIVPGAGGSATVENIPVPGPDLCLRVKNGRVSEYLLIQPDGVSFPTLPPTEAGTVGGSLGAAGDPHHLDPRVRAEIFNLCRAAREEGSALTPSARSSLATELESEKERLCAGSEIDLGLSACIADLRMSERPGPENLETRSGLVNWDGQGDWSPTFYPMPVLSPKNSGQDFEISSQPSIYTIGAGPLVLPLALDPAPGDVLTVLFHGALDRARMRAPLFSRWRFQRQMNAGPTLAFADPTLDLARTMRLGWYLGTEHVDVTSLMAQVVGKVARDLGARRVVLVGSSGGGFAALHVGALVERAEVVAMSPQTDLRRYWPRLVWDALAPALGISREPTDPRTVQRISAVERMRAAGVFPRTVLVSNAGDVPHLMSHAAPLRSAYREAGHDTHLETVDVDLGRGHRAVGNEMYRDILTDVYERRSGWPG